MTAGGQAAALMADGPFLPDTYKAALQCPAAGPAEKPKPAPAPAPVECKVMDVTGLAEVTIPSVAGEECCSALSAHILHKVSGNPMLTNMGGWAGISGMLGVTSCSVPADFGQ